MKLKLTWQRLHSNHFLFPLHFAFSFFSSQGTLAFWHCLYLYTSVYVYSILFPSSMYSDSTLQQLIGLAYMVDSTYIVLFFLCLFTTSSKCTMFTGVILICGFSLSLSLSRTLPLSLCMILFVLTHIQKTCPGVGSRLLPAKLFFGSTFYSIRLCQACEGSNIYDCPSWEVGGDGNLGTDVQATLGQRHRYVKWWCLQKSANTLQSPSTRKDHCTKDCDIVWQLPDRKDKTESAWKVLYGFF